MAHGNGGRKPPTTTARAVQERVRELAKGVYAGLNHTHLTEMLAEREGIGLSRSTMRRILLAGGGIRSPRRRRDPKHRSRRQPGGGLPRQDPGRCACSIHSCHSQST